MFIAAIVLIIVLVVVVFGKSEQAIQEIEETKGPAPTPQLAAMNLVQWVIRIIGWVVFAGALTLLIGALSVIGGL